jgi:hypothetical protein
MNLCVTGISTGRFPTQTYTWKKWRYSRLLTLLRKSSQGLIQTHICTYLALLSPRFYFLLLLMVWANG